MSQHGQWQGIGFGPQREFIDAEKEHRDREDYAVAPVHKKQVLTYLRLSNKRVGLLINFNVELIKDGITRLVNGLKE